MKVIEINISYLNSQKGSQESYERHKKTLFSILDSLYSFTQNEKEYIAYKISNVMRRRFNCIDNERFAVSTNSESLFNYNEQLQRGCCGFYDTVIKLKSGIDVLFGFNYGH